MQGSKTKDWSDALRRAVHRESAGKGSPKWLDVIAVRVCEAAADGDPQAFKEIGDRLDGRPKQETESKMDVKGSLELVKRIAR